MDYYIYAIEQMFVMNLLKKYTKKYWKKLKNIVIYVYATLMLELGQRWKSAALITS